ncbi:M4 family metallopeptidase [Candidatus Gottesmanbacteria bacterium]|nr:M4 family metallopeptidase [Candidatus Gottesmanbacteria bacterium]
MKKSRYHLFNTKILLLFLLNLITAGLVVSTSSYFQGKAQTLKTLNTSALSGGSYFSSGTKVMRYSLYSEEGNLYTTQSSGAAGIAEFLNSPPSYSAPSGRNTVGIMGRVVGGDDFVKIVPDGFFSSSTLSRVILDSEDSTSEVPPEKQGEHYFYTQTIGGTPVYAAQMILHERHGNEIYAIDATLTTSTEVTVQTISEDQARGIALGKAKSDYPNAQGFRVMKVEPYIVNLSILGVSDDETNYSTFAVFVEEESENPQVAMKYFIERSNGTVIFEESLLKEANREIKDCNVGGCPIVRTEGQPAYGDADVDGSYDVLGSVYNYVSKTLHRNSYDNHGAKQRAWVHVDSTTPYCPNAWWYGDHMRLCNGMVAYDVIGHEFGHGVTDYTSNFVYKNQSGALDESWADIMGSEMDGNWMIGENTSIPNAPFRYMDDPPKKSDPDRLYSNYYYCGTSDAGGVHTNSGVMNKTYYLLVEGGSFNGCTMQGIERQKAIQIVYRAMDKYLSAGSNFRDMAEALKRSCNDLYKTGSTCDQVRKVVEATEIVQQPPGLQTCTHVARKTPQCGNPTPTPTTQTPHPSKTPTPTQPSTPTRTPTPTIPGQPTKTPTPTLIPGQPTKTPTPIQANRTPTPTLSANTTFLADWKMDENSGNNVSDSKKNHDGTAYQTTITNGKEGLARVFDRNKKSYVEIPMNQNLKPQSFTVGFWVKGVPPPGPSGFDYTQVPQKYLGGFSSSQYFFTNTDIVSYSGITFRTYRDTVYFLVGKGQITSDSLSLPQNLILDGTWHSVVGTYGSGEMALYIDGAKKASKSVSGEIKYSSARNLYFGAIGPEGLYYDGALDEVQMYRGVLSTQEIRSRFGR